MQLVSQTAPWPAPLAQGAAPVDPPTPPNPGRQPDPGDPDLPPMSDPPMPTYGDPPPSREGDPAPSAPEPEPEPGNVPEAEMDAQAGTPPPLSGDFGVLITLGPRQPAIDPPPFIDDPAEAPGQNPDIRPDIDEPEDLPHSPPIDLPPMAPVPI